MKKMNPKLTKEEKEILTSYERGEWKSIPNVKEQMAHYQKIAADTMKKDQRVNIRISSYDLAGLRAKAIEEGIPYQTLISSVIHKYLTGKLSEV